MLFIRLCFIVLLAVGASLGQNLYAAALDDTKTEAELDDEFRLARQEAAAEFSCTCP